MRRQFWICNWFAVRAVGLLIMEGVVGAKMDKKHFLGKFWGK